MHHHVITVCYSFYRWVVHSDQQGERAQLQVQRVSPVEQMQGLQDHRWSTIPAMSRYAIQCLQLTFDITTHSMILVDLHILWYSSTCTFYDTRRPTHSITIAKLGRRIARFITIPSATRVDYPIIDSTLQSPFDMAQRLKPFAPHFVVLNDVALYRKGDILGEKYRKDGHRIDGDEWCWSTGDHWLMVMLPPTFIFIPHLHDHDQLTTVVNRHRWHCPLHRGV